MSAERKPARALLPVLWAVSVSLAGAVQAAEPQPARGARQQPIQIEADRAELTERENVSVYSGRVRLRQGDLEMTGDRLQVQRAGQNGEITAVLTGNPAELRQTGAQPVVARARRIDYQSRDKTMVLQGGAEVIRGKDRITSENIRYSAATQHLTADGDGKPGDRVQITIQPGQAQ